MLLLNIPITAASGPLATAPFHTRGIAPPSSIVLQATFHCGSGGTAVDCDVQTSIDGVTFLDVANFNFAATSARLLFNLSALTPQTSQLTPTDGTLDPNTCIDGIIGHLWRCKYTTTGLYAGGTTLRIDAFAGTHFDLG
jgi:hypothetical protein